MSGRETLTRSSCRWTDAVFLPGARSSQEATVPLGVLTGEGIGPEVIAASLRVLSATGARTSARVQVRVGGPIGNEAELLCGHFLSEDVGSFCESVFADGGAVLAGPGGGRFVYDLRRRFDLFCKISPVRVSEAAERVGRLDPSTVRNADLLVVRENAGGVYMGESRDFSDPAEGRVCEQKFRYSEREVRRIIEVAASLAAGRRGGLAVVVKDGGMPGMTALWRDVAEQVGRRAGIRPTFLNVDLAAYALIQEPRSLDVIVAFDLFGDILADASAVLLGGRGLSFSGNFSAAGAAVYQTNHGCAVDIAGKDRANPIGQVGALAMAMRESLGLAREAEWVEQGVEEVLRHGIRTFDIAPESGPGVGTKEMGEHIAAAVERIARAAAR